MQSVLSFHLFMGHLGSNAGSQACIAITLPFGATSPALGSVSKQLPIFHQGNRAGTQKQNLNGKLESQCRIRITNFFANFELSVLCLRPCVRIIWRGFEMPKALAPSQTNRIGTSTGKERPRLPAQMSVPQVAPTATQLGTSCSLVF